jgi:hypothetical protein
MKAAQEKAVYSLPLLLYHFRNLTVDHGLCEETSREAGLFSATSLTLNLILNRNDITCDGVVIPYKDLNRARLDIPLILNGSESKYMSPTGSKNHLYVPKPVIPVLHNIAQPPSFTKLCLKAPICSGG